MTFAPRQGWEGGVVTFDPSQGEGGVVQGEGGVVTFDPKQGGGRCCLGGGRYCPGRREV